MKKILSYKLLLLLIAAGTAAVAIAISPIAADKKPEEMPGQRATPAQAGGDLAITPDSAQKNQSSVYQQQGGKIVFDVTLHTADEIRALLKRSEELSHTIPTGDDVPGIALVLHGNEIKYFAKKNREQFRDIVDLAMKLDQNNIIDIKMCRTMMRYLEIGEDEVPDFIDLVPYGPDEVKRLQREGYKIYL
ncbi:MAG: hypothetical protein BMS9Abin26_0637 [Gammaproteobacteria bacterium]|nr:MAG: hypothetical protein BMS9Abin26_0637 [Gammaproteobacteria bacterium]